MLHETTVSALQKITSISTDVLVIFGVVSFFAIIGFIKSKKIPLVTLFSLYPATIVTVFFPFYTFSQIEQYSKQSISLLVFGISFTAFFWVLQKNVHVGYHFNKMVRFVDMVVLASGVTGFFFSVASQVLQLHTYYTFGSFFTTFFSSPIAFFVWILFPLFYASLFARS